MMTGTTAQSCLMTPDAAAERIRGGEWLAIAGDRQALQDLPAGNWIGGSIPYFMGQDGGETSREKVHVTPLPVGGESPVLRRYAVGDLHRLCMDGPDNGYTLLILPAMSTVHELFSRKGPEFEDMFLKPLLGWVAGFHLDHALAPAAVDGTRAEFLEDMAVALHVPLPDNEFAEIGIVNIFEQDDGDVIRFPDASFEVGDCLINGEPANLAHYLRDRAVDTRLPLVADYCGTSLNVSIKESRPDEDVVSLYAPVFPDTDYRLARPVDDYVGAFEQALPPEGRNSALTFNCVLNYLYSGLEGRRTEGFDGPMTFGEVAYQLLNQTMVYMAVRELD